MKLDDCIAKHANVESKINELGLKLDEVVNTLIGKPEPGSLERKNGIVQDLREIKNGMKRKWTSKEKVAILTTFIMAAAAIIAALLK